MSSDAVAYERHGGWHDAGDYGKYVVNAGVTVGCLFLAWDHFQDKIKNTPLNLPDTAPGYPGFLKELKWETDWSSAAVADFVAMTAMAARYFKPYDAEYSQRCLDAASPPRTGTMPGRTTEPMRSR